MTAIPSHRIVDVPYAQLMTDPIGALETIYKGAGLELTSKTAAKMSAYSTRIPKGEFGKHSYRLEELGLDGDAIAERFSRYSRRHDVEREAF